MRKSVMSSSGYSKTSLAKKLGIKAGFAIDLINAPAYYFDLFTDLPADLLINPKAKHNKYFIHFFCKRRTGIEDNAAKIKKGFGPKRHDMGFLAQKILRYINGSR